MPKCPGSRIPPTQHQCSAPFSRENGSEATTMAAYTLTEVCDGIAELILVGHTIKGNRVQYLLSL